MNHILDPSEPGIHRDRYLEALAGYRHRLSPHVAQFAGDVDRFKLNHPDFMLALLRWFASVGPSEVQME